MIKAVIFDMDGVLIDSEVEYMERFHNQFAEVGVHFSKEKANQLIGSSSQRTDEIIAETLEGIMSVEEFWASWKEKLKENPIDYYKIRVAGAYELLASLKEKGYKIAIASSTDMKGILSQMETAKLLPFFDVVSSGHEFENSKPDPTIYIETLKRLGITSQECVVVEDSPYGIEAGKRAGCYVIGRKVDVFDIDQSKADELVRELPQVLSILERMQGV